MFCNFSNSYDSSCYWQKSCYQSCEYIPLYLVPVWSKYTDRMSDLATYMFFNFRNSYDSLPLLVKELLEKL